MNYFTHANELYKLKDYKSAIDMYKKSADINEYKAPSLYNSAVCFIKLKNYKGAIPLICKALDLRQESKYYFNLGYCYLMLNENGKALNYFNTAWSMDNNDDECEKAINLILSKYKKQA
ncbi:MAG: CDC27 family protein [Clostridium sp.]|uniref:tetratricopeptide repeat protein n=1 Tax=Clostridium sp. TaxID=1506 RepID=UPI003047FEFC